MGQLGTLEDLMNNVETESSSYETSLKRFVLEGNGRRNCVENMLKRIKQLVEEVRRDIQSKREAALVESIRKVMAQLCASAEATKIVQEEHRILSSGADALEDKVFAERAREVIEWTEEMDAYDRREDRVAIFNYALTLVAFMRRTLAKRC
ncbi:hypothetical protein ERJ75_001207800 [Trypanosoma vivax]|nr:hypothetical protein ERJ75_001207800 [Trypanosoma vivax]